MSIASNLVNLKTSLPDTITLVAVSKTKTANEIMQAYNEGQRIFGENKVQEMVDKWEQLPKDIEWHMIGHLQTNKIKYIAPFINLIHGVDSLNLLEEINKQAKKNNRIINCLLQIHIAEEETKFGMNEVEAEELLASPLLTELNNIKVLGLMGIATFTNNEEQIKNEFLGLKYVFERLKTTKLNVDLRILSMGMTGDYLLAIDAGSTLIRIGSKIFGERN